MKKYLQKLTGFIKRHKIALIIGVVVLAPTGIFVRPKIKAAIEGPKAKHEITKVEKKDIKSLVSASGRVEAESQVALKFQTSGKLAWVGVKEGDEVKKWQAIASLDKRELEKDLRKELNDYMDERWDFEQTQEDYRETKERHLVTDAIRRILDKAQWDLENTVIDLEIADLAVKLATIVSPIDGIVTNIASPIAGVNITPATAEFIIAGPSQMKFMANVDEEDIGQIRSGQKVTVALDAYPEEEFEGTVDKIAFASITTKGGGTAFRTSIYLPENTDQRFRVGMNGDAEIIIEEKTDVLSLPLEAVKEENSQTYVEIIENRIIKKVDIEIGLSTDTRVEILSGLSKDQEVITGKKKESP